MVLVTSTCLVPGGAIRRHLGAHRAWLDTHYEGGAFVISGRLLPPTGGFMRARGIDREELEALLATDPFRLHGRLDHTVTELAPTRAAPGLSLEELS